MQCAGCNFSTIRPPLFLPLSPFLSFSHSLFLSRSLLLSKLSRASTNILILLPSLFLLRPFHSSRDSHRQSLIFLSRHPFPLSLLLPFTIISGASCNSPIRAGGVEQGRRRRTRQFARSAWDFSIARMTSEEDGRETFRRGRTLR